MQETTCGLQTATAMPVGIPQTQSSGSTSPITIHSSAQSGKHVSDVSDGALLCVSSADSWDTLFHYTR